MLQAEINTTDLNVVFPLTISFYAEAPTEDMGCATLIAGLLSYKQMSVI